MVLWGKRKEGIGTATFVSKRKEGLKLVFAGKRNGVIGMAASVSNRRGSLVWWCLQVSGR